MRNILLIVSSSVGQGNTERLADAFATGATEAGHVLTKVFMDGKRLEDCRGCGFCQMDGHKCVIQDSMQDIYELFAECDTLVFASPLYFGSVNGKMKNIIDRLYAVSGKDKYPHKDAGLLMTADDEGEHVFDQACSYFDYLVKSLGWTNLGFYGAGGCHGGAGTRSISEEHLMESYRRGRMLE